MRLLILTLAAVLTACASTPEGDISTARSSWQGASYDEVVARWGVPARSTRLAEGRDAYAWVSETVAPRSAIFPSLGIFGGSHGGVGIGTGVTVGPGGGELQRCERTLIFQNGRVIDQTWQGSADFCSSFRK